MNKLLINISEDYINFCFKFIQSLFNNIDFIIIIDDNDIDIYKYDILIHSVKYSFSNFINII